MSDATDDARESGSNRSGQPSMADWALIQAIRAWHASGEHASSEPLGAPVWRRLDPAWGNRLREALNKMDSEFDPSESARPLARLQAAHVAAASVDLGRVHASWWVRALEDESPAVQRVVAAAAPDAVRGAVSDGLLLDRQDLSSVRAIQPEVKSWVLALWTERMVGGEPAGPGDPPVIAALSAISPRAGYRLCQMIGVAKGVLAARVPVNHPPTTADRVRWDWLQTELAAVDPRFRALAWEDVQAVTAPKVPKRHHAARIGLFTVARLLADCDAFRIRWAMQHWPYPLAKLLRAQMLESSQRPEWTLSSESRILKAAWNRLNLEGRLLVAWPGLDSGISGSEVA